MAHAFDETTRTLYLIYVMQLSPTKYSYAYFWIVNFVIGQVPTEKGMISHQVVLDVLVPDVFILGPKDLIVDRGTTLSLVCIVENVSYKLRHRYITQIELMTVYARVCVCDNNNNNNKCLRCSAASASAMMTRSDKTKERETALNMYSAGCWVKNAKHINSRQESHFIVSTFYCSIE